MKTTAKPAGPVHFDKVTRRIAELVEPYREICDLTESEFPVDDEDRHGEFITDAFNVYHETGLTPREILAQRDELMAALKVAIPVLDKDKDLSDNEMVWCHQYLQDRRKALRLCQDAIQKASTKEGGEG